MDYCDQQTLHQVWSSSVKDVDIQWVKELLIKWTPVSVILCVLNFILTYFSIRRKDTGLSRLLNYLLTTSCISSLICSIEVVATKFLPLFHNIVISDCFLLALEVCQTASLFACGFHQLTLTWVLLQEMSSLRKPTPLLLMTEHDEKYFKMLLTATMTWILPGLLVFLYFWSIPCQGFRSGDCDFTFFMTFNHRLVVLGPIIFLVVSILILYIILCKESHEAKTNFVTVLDVTTTSNKESVKRSYDRKFYTRWNFCMGETWLLEQRRLELEKISTISFLFFLTFLVAWSPRMIWLALSCIDGCPFPLLQQSFPKRSLIGTVTETMVIIKAAIDSIIFILNK